MAVISVRMVNLNNRMLMFVMFVVLVMLMMMVMMVVVRIGRTQEWLSLISSNKSLSYPEHNLFNEKNHEESKTNDKFCYRKVHVNVIFCLNIFHYLIKQLLCLWNEIKEASCDKNSS